MPRGICRLVIEGKLKAVVVLAVDPREAVYRRQEKHIALMSPIHAVSPYGR